MATKRANGYGKAAVKKAFEEILEDGAAFVRQLAHNRKSADYKHMVAQQTANLWAAKKFGFTCMQTTDRGDFHCTADPGGIQKGTKIPRRRDVRR